MTLLDDWTHLDDEMVSLSRHFRDFAAGKQQIKSALDFTVLEECLLEGLLSRAWQAWSGFCRRLVIASCMGTIDASGAEIAALPGAVSEAHVSGAAIQAKKRDPDWVTANTSLRAEPTWGDVDVLETVLTRLRPNNVTQMLAALSHGSPWSKALQLIRNGAAHSHIQNLRDIRALSSAYVAFPIRHATHAMFWTEPISRDFMVTHAIGELRTTGLAAIT
jgi:hypothetical protein